jgi:hypothetical protein
MIFLTCFAKKPRCEETYQQKLPPLFPLLQTGLSASRQLATLLHVLLEWGEVVWLANYKINRDAWKRFSIYPWGQHAGLLFIDTQTSSIRQETVQKHMYY